MKLYYNNLLIKSLVLLVLLIIINLPINNLTNFSLFLACVSVIIFIPIKLIKNFYYPFLFIFIYFFFEVFVPSLKIQEGHNIVIINEYSDNFYKNNLPIEVYSFFKKQYFFYKNKSQCDSNRDNCWKNFDPHKKRHNTYPTTNIFSKSADWSIFKIKYSRIVNKINFNNIKSAKLGEINNLTYNFFWGDKFDLVRENVPFFVMYEVPKTLINSSICWKGNIFWQGKNNFYEHIFNHKLDCKIFSEIDIGKKIYATSLGKGDDYNRLNYLYGDNFIKKGDELDNFLSKNELNVKLKKSSYLINLEYFKLFVKIILIIFILQYYFKFNFKIYSFAILHTIIFLFLVYIVNKDLIFGFDIYTGGNDGLTYSSYGNLLFSRLQSYNFYEFFRGVESVFYMPSSLRYFWPINKIIFGETFYGYMFIAYIYIIVLFYIFKLLFGIKWAIFLTLLIYLTRALEGYALSLFNFLEHINSGDAEPIAIFFIMCSLLIFINIIKNQYNNNYLFYFLFGFFIFLSISFRPNYLPTGALFVFIFSIYNYINNNNKISIFFILFGFSFFLLIPFHNYIYGNSLILLSSGARYNTHASINIYINAIIDLLKFNVFNSPYLQIIIDQIIRWIQPFQIHYIITFFIIFLTFFYKNNFIIKIICLLALSQHSVLLIYEPADRYAYLAWILTFIVSINFINMNKNLIMNYFKKSSTST